MGSSSSLIVECPDTIFSSPRSKILSFLLIFLAAIKENSVERFSRVDQLDHLVWLARQIRVPALVLQLARCLRGGAVPTLSTLGGRNQLAWCERCAQLYFWPIVGLQQRLCSVCSVLCSKRGWRTKRWRKWVEPGGALNPCAQCFHSV